MIKYFDNEEIATMSLYKARKLNDLIREMQTDLPITEDKLMAESIAQCIDGLCSMTPEEFDEILPKLEAPEMI